MKLQELLDKDTSGLSLSQMIDAVDGALDNSKNIYMIRRRHEEDTGIPMEEDDFGKLFSVKLKEAFPGIIERLKVKE